MFARLTTETRARHVIAQETATFRVAAFHLTRS
jgi:hypothetical protein